jgi:enterochelin esterase-like enzyme
MPNPEAAYEAYAAWLTEVVVPRARKEAPVIADAAHTALDGVSLGGQIGVEVFVRRPEAFGVWGSVQGALNAVRLPAYAEKIAAALARSPRGPRAAVHLETSDADPFRETNVALAAMLAKKGVPCDLEVLPGLHDQVFLREAGTLSMLLWHDRRMRS